MSSADLVALVCCDLGAIVRGRSVLSAELGAHLDAGVGWVPANMSLTPRGPLADATPFHSVGDLRLLPDVDTHVRVEANSHGGALELVLCDIVETDGCPWDCCPRRFLREALEDLREELGACVVASFEHEFQLLEETPPAAPFSLAAQWRAEPFPSQVMDALIEAGAQPERYLAEFSAHQFEIPVDAAEGLAAADRAVVLREVVREIARRHGSRASFAPLVNPAEAGNGVHIHLNLRDEEGQPLLYDATRPASLSELGGRFAAGILRHAAALGALTAASPPSAVRLTPHRWSTGAVALGPANREALLRIPSPVTLGGGDPAGQLHLEYRAADATANPYLALGAILRAGLEGVRSELDPPPLLEVDPGRLDAAEAQRFGVGALPRSLEESLEALAGDEVVRGWMAPRLYEAYVGIKRAEIDAVAGLDIGETCRRYAAIY
ncbi:MAG TPA: glutamine synthetase family protein [Solirubrobacteraceae bacterium]|jgi:glutamine synthetase